MGFALIFSLAQMLMLPTAWAANDSNSTAEAAAQEETANSQYKPTATVGVIKNFDVKVQVNADSSLDITEKIAYDFGNFERHGIYRTIPVKYKINKLPEDTTEVSENIKNTKVLGDQYNLRVKEISVTDEKGTVYNFTTSREGDNLKIKIGDEDVMVSGEKNYVIKYQVWRAVGFFSDHDELYWNVTGDEWQEPILAASLKVELPQKVIEQELKQACYTGESGSTQHFCLAEVTGDNQITYRVEPGRVLAAGEGLTAILSWPKGLVNNVSKKQEWIWMLMDNLGVLYAFIIPVLAFVILFILWFRRGRDPHGNGTIIPRYGPPDNLTAQEVGTIIDEKVDNVDISSLIISLAIKGYLKIKELPGKKVLGFSTAKDYLLINKKFVENDRHAEGLEDFEKKFLAAIFDSVSEVKISDLKNKFYKDIPKIQEALYQTTVSKSYFPKNPNTVRSTYLGVGIAFCVLSIPFASIFFQSGFAIFANVVVSLMIMIFGWFMPRRTAKGVEAKEHILGLKEYMQVAEADRIKFHNAPEKSPEVFEELLPFAMVLGVEKEWAKQFEGLQEMRAEWYEGGDGLHTFNSLYLVNSLSGMSRTANAAFVSRPGGASSGGSGFSSGGGFSGGGFGGGGGGSW